MPVPSTMKNSNEKIIRIQKEGNMSLTPQTPNFPGMSQDFGNNSSQNHKETRSWSQSSYSTKKVVQSSASPEPVITQHSTTTTNKSSDLFSNKHNDGSDRRGSTSSTTSNTTSNNRNTSTQQQLKSSSLVSKALQEFEDDVNQQQQNLNLKMNQNQNKQHSSQQQSSYKEERRSSKTVIPSSTPNMEIVPSGGNGTNVIAPWSMGTDAQGEVPLTYEIVTRSDGKKEFQLLLTTRDFSPEDLQVKLTDNTLTISGNHEERSPSGAYSSKSFYRTCTIPSGVRPEDLNCSLDSCGRLKISAPVPDVDNSRHTSTKMITTKSSTSSKHNNQWHEDGNIPSGFKISPGEKEDVMSVFNSNDNNIVDISNGMSGLMNNQHQDNGSSTTTKSMTTTTKTVKTFKTVS